MSVTAAGLWQMTAVELARTIRDKRASSEEVVEAHLRRIEAVNPLVNAIPMVLADGALDAARRSDRLLAAGEPLGPFHGVPFTVKSNIDVLGTPTTHGVRAFLGAYPTADAPVVERMKLSGAIPIGRTNMPDFAISWHTQSELYGATVNPWDPSRTPGASSGGEGVALATGMSALGLGNDTLGSLRWPAQCSGVAALKPTLGRIPDATTLEPGAGPIGVQLAGAQGPLARCVADLRQAFQVLSGATWRDPWSVPVPLAGPALGRPIRVAVVLDPAGLGTAAQVEDGVRKAADALAAQGYTVELLEPPSIELASKCLLDMLDVRALWALSPPPVSDYTKAWIESLLVALGESSPLANVTSFMTRHALLRAWSEFQEAHALILAPIATEVPFMVGADRSPDQVAENLRAMRMVMAVNALGLPAVAVPVGIAEGLPQVVQIIGPRYREDLCLDAAAAIEERLGTITPISPASA